MVCQALTTEVTTFTKRGRDASNTPSTGVCQYPIINTCLPACLPAGLLWSTGKCSQLFLTRSTENEHNRHHPLLGVWFQHVLDSLLRDSFEWEPFVSKANAAKTCVVKTNGGSASVQRMLQPTFVKRHATSFWFLCVSCFVCTLFDSLFPVCFASFVLVFDSMVKENVFGVNELSVDANYPTFSICAQDLQRITSGPPPPSSLGCPGAGVLWAQQAVAEIAVRPPSWAAPLGQIWDPPLVSCFTKFEFVEVTHPQKARQFQVVHQVFFRG